jgi:hypothetical protein
MQFRPVGTAEFRTGSIVLRPKLNRPYGTTNLFRTYAANTCAIASPLIVGCSL